MRSNARTDAGTDGRPSQSHYVVQGGHRGFPGRTDPDDPYDS